MNAREQAPVLLYDGLCGFCDGFVQFVLARDTRGDMRFAPLQGTYAREVLARHPALQDLDSLVLVYPASATTNEKVAVQSDGAIAVAEYIGGIWALSSLFRLLPRALRDWGYKYFARHRYSWFGKRDSCRIPEAHTKVRFLE